MTFQCFMQRVFQRGPYNLMYNEQRKLIAAWIRRKCAAAVDTASESAGEEFRRLQTKVVILGELQIQIPWKSGENHCPGTQTFTVTGEEHILQNAVSIITQADWRPAFMLNHIKIQPLLGAVESWTCSPALPARWSANAVLLLPERRTPFQWRDTAFLSQQPAAPC